MVLTYGNALIPLSSLLPPQSVWEVNLEVLGEVARVREGRRWGWRRWWKEFNLSTQQPGNKLFITLVVERGPAHMFLKKRSANHMVQLIVLFVNMFHLQSWRTEGEWKEDHGTGHGWSGLGRLRLGPAPTPLPSSLWTSAMLLKRTLLSLEKVWTEAHRNRRFLRIQKFFM